MICWPTVRLAGMPAGQLPGWPAGWPAVCLASYSFHSFVLMTSTFESLHRWKGESELIFYPEIHRMVNRASTEIQFNDECNEGEDGIRIIGMRNTWMDCF